MVETSARTVGDRQKTAQRLLRSTADRSYDGEVDIDWDAPLVPGGKWTPEHLSPLYGTPLWNRLTGEQRTLLGMHQALSLLSFGIYAECGLGSALLLQVLAGNTSADDHARYALAEVGEECRHSTMFGRLIAKSGVKPYRYPAPAMRALRLLGLAPIGPASLFGLLLVEELLDRLQREALNDPDIQPHVKQLMKIHVLEEARHITFAREELVRQIAERGEVSNAIHRWAAALATLGIFVVLADPRIYRAVGINSLRGFVAAFTSAQYRRTAMFAAEPLLRFAYDAGMIRDPVTTRLYKLSRALPDDIRAAIDGTS